MCVVFLMLGFTIGVFLRLILALIVYCVGKPNRLICAFCESCWCPPCENCPEFMTNVETKKHIKSTNSNESEEEGEAHCSTRIELKPIHEQPRVWRKVKKEFLISKEGPGTE